MTRRILASFIGVLVAVLAGVVVPLGVLVTGQQADDFRADALNAGQAIGAVAEEHLDDKAPMSALRTVVTRFAIAGDRIAVLDARGALVAQGGGTVPPQVIEAVRAGAPLPAVPDAVAVATPIRDAGRPLGMSVLVRDAEPLHHRQAVLWTTLLAAAAATLVVGAVVGWSLGRWMTRPLTSLAGAAHGIGRGEPARADEEVGPRQVREVAVAFNDMADRVAALIEAQRGVTADVSHQLRTPLAALRLRLELLVGELPPEQGEEVASMVEETNRLARLVDGLLAVARADATAAAPQPQDLSALAAARVDAWRPVAAERGIEISLDVEHAVARATPGHLEQILDNLLDNAIEALSAGDRICVMVRARPDGAAVTIADNGPGMPAEQRAHALDRFVTDRDGGSGLGLAIVRRLVTADHGSAALTETPGGGLTVQVVLPATSSEVR